ncbi:MAG: 1-acyl-sn-glycerol-3-phosphate acyltransferase [Bacteroidales bacterium]|nr:1-acyl-sn-glycerol-3-phosphate acyltransferase [Bacteroidales bacterium]
MRLSVIKSLFIWLFYILLLIFLYPPALLIWIISWPFDKRLWLLQCYSNFWASTITWVTPGWKVEIEGREKIKSGKAYILVSNHQSMLDIILLYRLFAHYKWIAKQELFRVPVIGWNMTANRYIPLKRGSKSSVLRMALLSEKTLKEGSSLMIFPEGTRSETGEIKGFKDGAFKMAIKTKTPIIPIVLDGTGNALPKNGFEFSSKELFHIRILDEVPVDGLTDKDVKLLTSKIRHLMIDELKKMRTEDG